MEDRNLSKAGRRLLYAYEAGYRVQEDGTILSGQGKTLKLARSTHGYLRFYVQCRERGLKGPVLVHRLAAYQKFGEKMLVPGIQVRHLNGDKDDRTPGNISIGTASDNAMDIPEADRSARSKNAASKCRKLSDEKLKRFREDRIRGMSVGSLANKYGVAKSTAYYIISGRTYAQPPKALR